MRVRVLYFGVLKDIFARATEELSLPDAATVADLIALQRERTMGSAAALESIAVAVNQEYRRQEWVLQEGDEVALLPPVSGGRDAD